MIHQITALGLSFRIICSIPITKTVANGTHVPYNRQPSTATSNDPMVTNNKPASPRWPWPFTLPSSFDHMELWESRFRGSQLKWTIFDIHYSLIEFKLKQIGISFLMEYVRVRSHRELWLFTPFVIYIEHNLCLNWKSPFANSLLDWVIGSLHPGQCGLGSWDCIPCLCSSPNRIKNNWAALPGGLTLSLSTRKKHKWLRQNGATNNPWWPKQALWMGLSGSGQLVITSCDQDGWLLYSSLSEKRLRISNRILTDRMETCEMLHRNLSFMFLLFTK